MPMPTKKKKSVSKPALKAPKKAERFGVFEKIRRLFYSPEFYRSLPAQPFSKVLDRLLIFLSVSFLLSGVIGAFALSSARGVMTEAINEMQDAYPEELDLVLEEGTLSSNVQEPYFLAMPDSLVDEEMEVTANVVVIDTVTPFSIEKMKEYDASIWLSKNTMYTMEEDQKFQAIDYPSDFSLTVNQNTVDELPAKIWMLIRIPFLLAALIGFALLFVAGVVGLLLYVLLFAFFWFFLSMLFGAKRDYLTCTKFALTVLCPALLVYMVLHYVSFLALFHLPPLTLTVFLIAFLLLNGVFKREAASKGRKKA